MRKAKIPTGVWALGFTSLFMEALTKPVFPLAGSLGWIVAARFVDRVGKGIRGAPRDALVADLTPEASRGAAYGLRQTLDTVGAFTGPLIAIALMWLTHDNIPLVFWAAVLPALIAVVVLFTKVKEPPHDGRKPDRLPLSRAGMAALGPRFWAVTGVAALFSIAKFSEAFLVLKADHAGLTVALIPLVLIVMNLVYALAAYPAGALSDRRGRAPVLMIGIVALIAGDLVLALAPGLAGAFAGIALWGISMGFTQGAFAALVADSVPESHRGTGFGMLNLVSGVATLIASLLAGLIWDIAGPGVTFLTGAGLAGLALVALLAMGRLQRG
ncbi:MAG: MFS transporter [Maritimibacter sp.]